MSCSICYETFINPKDYTREEFMELFEKKTTTNNEHDDDKFMRFNSLIIQKDNPFKCNTPNCKKLYCQQCYIKIKQSDDEEDEWNYGKKDIFRCSYCRNIDYKDYMKNNVLQDMMQKVLGKEEFLNWFLRINY